MKRISRVMGMALSAAVLVFAVFPQSAAHGVVKSAAPTGTIVINSNRSATNTPNVTLALTWSAGTGSVVVRMRFSDDGAHWSSWEPLAAVRPYTLPGADGHKTVRVQYLDNGNNHSAVFSDYIRLDTTPPTGGIVINSGAATTTNRSVTLGLTWDDGAGSQVSRMRFSDNGSTWTAWMPPTAACAHTLPAGFGYHTVRVQYLDGAGNYSVVCNDYIKLVEPAPGTEGTIMLQGVVPLVMVWIPSGTFMMGSPDTEQGRYSDEGPQHLVTVSGFWMSKYEITKDQWYLVTSGVYTPWGPGPHVSNEYQSPAVGIMWEDTQYFLTRLNPITGKTFRLPSEAEWEYACRAGTSTRFYWGDDPGYTAVGDYAWCRGNCSIETYAHVVGQKLPNAWGLHDMIGNAWEWCQDRYNFSYAGAPTDGSAWESPTDSRRLFRGGAWDMYDNFVRSAYRGYYVILAWELDHSFYGFRIVRTPES